MRHSFVLRILRMLKNHLDDLQDVHIDIADILSGDFSVSDLLHHLGIDCKLSGDEIGEITREVALIADANQAEAIATIYAE